MLHEGVLAPRSGTATTVDRRAGTRVPFPAELIVTWFHDLRTPIRYRVIDAGEGGFRIRSSLPLYDGMTGMALKLLPEGQTINRTVMVAWIRPYGEDEHEAGLRML